MSSRDLVVLGCDDEPKTIACLSFSWRRIHPSRAGASQFVMYWHFSPRSTLERWVKRVAVRLFHTLLNMAYLKRVGRSITIMSHPSVEAFLTL